MLQQAELGLYRRLHGKVKCDCRDHLSSIKKRDIDCFSGVWTAYRIGIIAF